MKRDTERVKLYGSKLHERRKLMHVHVSKDLKLKLNTKKRALLANKGDSVKIMRGSNKGKTGKVAKLSYQKRVIYIEGVSRKNARGTEILIPFQPSNLMLVDLNMNNERKKEFGAAPKEEPKV